MFFNVCKKRNEALETEQDNKRRSIFKPIPSLVAKICGVVHLTSFGDSTTNIKSFFEPLHKQFKLLDLKFFGLLLI